MNEKIREMLIEARSNTTEGKFKPPTHVWAEEFARLIVKEVIEVCDDVGNASGEGPWFNGFMTGVEEVDRRVRQHFGVEE